MSKELEKKVSKMTLKDYYDSLPDRTCPKTDFVTKICSECHVSASAVRYWVLSGRKPQREWQCEKIAEITGIPAEHLFPNV